MTNKQKAFINEYVKCWNATQAALKAGYSEKTAYSSGARLLKDVEVSKEIQRRIEENTMTANEALIGVGDMARADVTNLMEVTHAGFTIELLDEDGNIKPEAQFIKKIKQQVVTKLAKNEEGEDTEIIYTEIEMYDRKDAYKTVLQKYGELKSRVEIEGVLGWKDFVENSADDNAETSDS